jgi:hypothetical protein
MKTLDFAGNPATAEASILSLANLRASMPIFSRLDLGPVGKGKAPLWCRTLRLSLF